LRAQRGAPVEALR
jgi:NAD(P)-dependent dehydrogenase (short-subunit alcohol dehydrogenase family)